MTVNTPVYVPLPKEYTKDVSGCAVPDRTLVNSDLAEALAKCEDAQARANWQLEQIRAAQPRDSGK